MGQRVHCWARGTEIRRGCSIGFSGQTCTDVDRSVALVAKRCATRATFLLCFFVDRCSWRALLQATVVSCLTERQACWPQDDGNPQVAGHNGKAECCSSGGVSLLCRDH